MKYITAYHMQSLVDELSKEAGLADYGRRALDFGRQQLAGRYGRQLAVGAGLGAFSGAATGDEENWKGRAMKGALLGGGLAGGRILATKAGRQAARTGLSHLGERQLYTFTGKGYKGRNIDVEKAREIGVIPKLPKSPTLAPIGPRSPADLKALEKYKSDMKMALEEEHALGKGFQHLPGVIQGAFSQPRELLRSGWERSGKAGKVFAGLGLAGAAHGAIKTPEEGGPGRLESALGSAGRSLGYLVAPGASSLTSLAPSLVGAGAARVAGGAGKVMDLPGRLIKARRAAQPAREVAPVAEQSYEANSGYGINQDPYQMYGG